MREIVLEAEVLYLHEPRFSRIREGGENVFSHFVQNIIWYSADHCEKSKLANVEKSREWEGATKEENKGLWSLLVKPLEPFECQFIVLRNCIN